MYKSKLGLSGMLFTLVGCGAGIEAPLDTDDSAGSQAQALVSGSTCDPANALNVVEPMERAMLDTIAYTEGTSREGTKDGYNVLVGVNKFFSSCDRHPNICQPFGSGSSCSTAAGRYQFLHGTWTGLGYSNIWPENQERGALKLMADKGVKLPDTVLGEAQFYDVIDKLSPVWASLPGNDYGQHTYSKTAVRAKYCEFVNCNATTTTPAIVEGSFVRDKASGEIYVVAGGAPIYVATPALVTKPTIDVTASDLAKLNAVPRDGTFINGATEVYVVVGGAPIYVSAWANVGGAPSGGTVRVDDAALNNAGGSGHYGHLRRVPADGSMLQDGLTHEAYVVAGGAPIYVTAWANVGGAPSPPLVKVDGAAIRAGGSATSGRYSHLNRVPADGTFLQDGVSGETFVTVGGAPLYISAWPNVGGAPAGAAVVKVDGTSLAAAGGADRFSHLNRVPADGAFLQDGVTHEAYVIAGGAPIYVTSWANVTPPAAPLPSVDGVTIGAAGAATGRYSHLNQVPANGTFVHSKDGTVYRVEGGAPIYVSSWSAFTAGDQALPKTEVDATSLANAGGALAHFKHLNAVPVDGTQLFTASGNKYVVQGGSAVPYTGSAAFPDVARVDQYAIDHAGGAGALSHLK